METMSCPLDGIRVLDLSRVLAGPWASQTLADLGAEVIKVERPGSGDDTRSWGAPFATDARGKATNDSAYFLSTNRGKKSVAIDITDPQGQKAIRELARTSDVLIENFKVGGLAKYGLDYGTLTQINPGLVYCSITGFGQTGPYRDRAGYDFMVQGLGGLMSVTGAPDSTSGGEPMKVGVAVADIFTGLYATIGILAALRHREQTGRGDYIDMALLDVQVAVLANQAMNYLVSGVSPARLGNAHPNIVPYQTFATSDGHFILAVGNDSQFRRFCETAGCPELADNELFANNAARVANREALVPLIEAQTRTRPTGRWVADLEVAGVPCGPINDLEAVFADEQVRHRGLRLDLPRAVAGTVPSVACPIRFLHANLNLRNGPPSLGEHTREVLGNLFDSDARGAQSHGQGTLHPASGGKAARFSQEPDG
jgi:crotonobetainyl-CoA:carnitine CoA-transferase CaiB-like acyl-CoA transferase